MSMMGKSIFGNIGVGILVIGVLIQLVESVKRK
ncbi:hypothetical protein ALPO108162_16510 [Alicyclobacillus pomorum]